VPPAPFILQGRIPRWLPPSESPERGTALPPQVLNNTARYGLQDEPLLRSPTLNMYLSLRQEETGELCYAKLVLRGAEQPPPPGAGLVRL
jgi:hypothetical protein